MAVVLIVLLVVLPCVYVLSIGPAWYLACLGGVYWQEVFAWFYSPLLWVCKHLKTLDSMLLEHLKWWTPTYSQ